MIGVNEIQINVYCVRLDNNTEILVDEEIYDEFDRWIGDNFDIYFKEWCEENDYDTNAENWDDIRDEAYDKFYNGMCDETYDKFYDEMCDEMWEDFSEECILGMRTINRKLW